MCTKSSQKEDDDGDGNSSFSCLKKCIIIGSSGSFETYEYSDLDIIGGVFGTPVSTFYFGESRVCRVVASVTLSSVSPEPTSSSPAGTTETTTTETTSLTSVATGAATPSAGTTETTTAEANNNDISMSQKAVGDIILVRISITVVSIVLLFW